MSDRISPQQLSGNLRAGSITVKTAVILGSGLSMRYSGASPYWPVAYGDIEGMTGTGVAGHEGCIFPGKNGLLIFSGRNHVYENGDGRSQEAMVRLASAMGCGNILITQAAGSLRVSLPPGSWMLASDTISFPYRKAGRMVGTGDRPSGKSGGSGPSAARTGQVRRPSRPLLSSEMREAVRAAARAAGVPVRDGVLFWTPGPNYETRAESMMMETAGADAVTMSPLPELAEAKRLGMRAASLSWITNHTANVRGSETGHEGVIEMGRTGRVMLASILEKFSCPPPE